jgi:Ca2+-binding RTX toxin-like protein
MEETVHIHHHIHLEGVAPTFLLVDLLAQIKGLRNDMSQVLVAVGKLNDVNANLANEVNAALSALANEIAGEAGKIATAVNAALAAAGVDDTNAAAAIDAATAGEQALIDKIKTALTGVGTGVGGDTTQAGGSGDDTVSGGGTDTVTGGNGADSTQAGGQGTDTVAAPEGGDSTLTGGNGADTTTA